MSTTSINTPSASSPTEFYSGDDLPAFLGHWVRSSVPMRGESRSVRTGQLSGSRDFRDEHGGVVSTVLYFTQGDPQAICSDEWDGDDSTAQKIERVR